MKWKKEIIKLSSPSTKQINYNLEEPTSGSLKRIKLPVMRS